MDVIRRSFSMIIKLKGSKTKPELTYEIYLGHQAQLAMDNEEDYKKVMEREVIFYEGKKIKVSELKQHILKSTQKFIDEYK